MTSVEFRLGDVADVAWGDTNTTKASYAPEGYPAYSATGRDGYLDYFDYDQPGIVVSAIGAQCGKSWYATGKWSCIKNTIRIFGKPGVSDSRYLYYAACAPGFFPSRGSAQPFIAQTDARNVLLRLPPLEEQVRISKTLGSLDDLIEVNRRLVSQLDELVSLLGEDLRSSVSGRSRVSLMDIASVSKGYSYKSTELVAGGGWLVSLKNVGRSGSFEARGFKPLKATVKEHQIVDNGSILVAQTDLTQQREVIARPVRVRRGKQAGQLVASLDLAVVRPKAPHTNESIFAVLDSEDFRSHALGYCNGTTVLHMGAKALPDYWAPHLTEEEIVSFSSRVGPLLDAADRINEEILELESTRDGLLPLLLSGSARVEQDKR